MAIVTGLFAYSALQKAAPTTRVIVAAREIPAYTLITSEDVAVKSVPGGGVPDGVITDLSGGSVMGRYTTRGLLLGDTVARVI